MPKWFRFVGWLLLQVSTFVRDSADVDRAAVEGDPSVPARDDDVLDAWLDEDEIDLTGL